MFDTWLEDRLEIEDDEFVSYYEKRFVIPKSANKYDSKNDARRYASKPTPNLFLAYAKEKGVEPEKFDEDK